MWSYLRRKAVEILRDEAPAVLRAYLTRLDELEREIRYLRGRVEFLEEMVDEDTRRPKPPKI